jgi:hypothetical protein
MIDKNGTILQLLDKHIYHSIILKIPCDRCTVIQYFVDKKNIDDY